MLPVSAAPGRAWLRPADSPIPGRDFRPRALVFPPAMEAATSQLYICTSCGFIYDPAEGDPDGGIPAGTAFEEIPDDWFCPAAALGARFRAYDG